MVQFRSDGHLAAGVGCGVGMVDNVRYGLAGGQQQILDFRPRHRQLA